MSGVRFRYQNVQLHDPDIHVKTQRDKQIVGHDCVAASLGISAAIRTDSVHSRSHGDVIVVNPGRRQQSRLSLQMTDRGYAYSETKLSDFGKLTFPFAGRILHFHIKRQRP